MEVSEGDLVELNQEIKWTGNFLAAARLLSGKLLTVCHFSSGVFNLRNQEGILIKVPTGNGWWVFGSDQVVSPDPRNIVKWKRNSK